VQLVIVDNLQLQERAVVPAHLEHPAYLNLAEAVV
jgi:hypothetical protein